ncbi:MAG: hypothetical protein COT81_00420 [Candidatus Buchananbacteria bacterium CG10_big_fil_rev_8_21_14_0_10_42_9]|uniref:Uncharacterized protein n=1 Tax=Candidatus Buchananbacteria bacterium CG10_big_fil_rev_8_21_14_0_10_42_9 TaxID=1974526 RepID=A0A2H0W2M6_9BACT|nr:MAG: hypothetical protein COT81_00420 [Candidatus Buchananbacteria bacterium CG10_big_fil_rev_8_21_14_0_10_42_9]
MDRNNFEKPGSDGGSIDEGRDLNDVTIAGEFTDDPRSQFEFEPKKLDLAVLVEQGIDFIFESV